MEAYLRLRSSLNKNYNIWQVLIREISKLLIHLRWWRNSLLYFYDYLSFLLRNRFHYRRRKVSDQPMAYLRLSNGSRDDTEPRSSVQKILNGHKPRGADWEITVGWIIDWVDYGINSLAGLSWLLLLRQWISNSDLFSPFGFVHKNEQGCQRLLEINFRFINVKVVFGFSESSGRYFENEGVNYVFRGIYRSNAPFGIYNLYWSHHRFFLKPSIRYPLKRSTWKKGLKLYVEAIEIAYEDKVSLPRKGAYVRHLYGRLREMFGVS